VSTKRRQYTSQFKFKVALETVKEIKTINEIASVYNLHPTQIRKWRKQLITEGASVFGSNLNRQLQEKTDREAELFEQIGRLKMEMEWLKKKATPID
jgi:transposase-like protein